jgi:predicted phage tail protein
VSFDLADDLVKAVSGHESESEVKRSATGGTATLDQHENIVEHYKELIREQDVQLTAVRNELRDAKSKMADAIKSAAQANEQLQTIKDQNALLKAQKGMLYSGVC